MLSFTFRMLFQIQFLGCHLKIYPGWRYSMFETLHSIGNFSISQIVLPIKCSNFFCNQYFHWFLKCKMINFTVIFLSCLVRYQSRLQPQIIKEILVNFRISFISDGFSLTTMYFQHVEIHVDGLLSHGQKPKAKEERTKMKWDSEILSSSFHFFPPNINRLF